MHLYISHIMYLYITHIMYLCITGKLKAINNKRT